MRNLNRAVVAGAVLAFTSAVATPAAAAVFGGKRPQTAPDRPDCAPSAAVVCPCPASDADASFGRFGVELLGAVSGEGRTNALVSPFGIGTVLAMLAQGATEPVRLSIREMLGVGTPNPTGDAAGQGDSSTDADTARMQASGPVDALPCGLAAVLGAASEDEGVELRIANAAFADRRLDLFPSFAAVLGDRFGARVERIDFADEGAVGWINAWVCAQDRRGHSPPRVPPRARRRARARQCNALPRHLDTTVRCCEHCATAVSRPTGQGHRRTHHAGGRSAGPVSGGRGLPGRRASVRRWRLRGRGGAATRGARAGGRAARTCGGSFVAGRVRISSNERLPWRCRE